MSPSLCFVSFPPSFLLQPTCLSAPMGLLGVAVVPVQVWSRSYLISGLNWIQCSCHLLYFLPSFVRGISVSGGSSEPQCVKVEVEVS
jgi:hypothetical protein